MLTTELRGGPGGAWSAQRWPTITEAARPPPLTREAGDDGRARVAAGGNNGGLAATGAGVVTGVAEPGLRWSSRATVELGGGWLAAKVSGGW